MPAPTSDLIKAQLILAYKAILNPDGTQRYTKKTIDSSGVVTVTGDLPDELMNMITAQANGISTTWQIWQSTQVVNVVSSTSLTPGIPGVGSLL